MHPMLVLGQDPHGNLVCAIADLPDEPGVVGIMLADVIRHVANAYCGDPESPKKAEIVLSIWAMLQAEMGEPTAAAVMVTEAGMMAPGGILLGEREGDDD